VRPLKAAPFLIIIFLANAVLAQEVSIEEKFPAVVPGTYYVYRTTPVGPHSTVIWLDSNVTVLDVNGSQVVVYEEHREYVNGTLDSVGNATFRIDWTNANWFLVFWNINNLTKHLKDWVLGLLSPWDYSNYSIVQVNYTWNNVTLPAYNLSYIGILYGENESQIKQEIYGYLVISIDYGLVLEKAQYMIFYNTITGAAIGENNAITRLIATNFRPLTEKYLEKPLPEWLRWLIFFTFIAFLVALIMYLSIKD